MGDAGRMTATEIATFDAELAKQVEALTGHSLFPQPKATANQKCRVCGCTEMRACPGGCSWAAPNLCSRCVE